MLESEVFDICYNINELILNSQMDTARTEVIKLLDRLNREGKEYSPMVNHFIREVGLFPYIEKIQHHGKNKLYLRLIKQILAVANKRRFTVLSREF